MEATLPPMLGDHLVRWPTVAEDMAGDAEASSATMGLDFLLIVA